MEAGRITGDLVEIQADIRELAGTGVDITAQVEEAAQLEGDLERIAAEVKELNATRSTSTPAVPPTGSTASPIGQAVQVGARQTWSATPPRISAPSADRRVGRCRHRPDRRYVTDALGDADKVGRC